MNKLDFKTKLNIVISIVLVALISGVAYWAQMPSHDLKAQVIDEDSVMINIQDFAYDPDLLKVESGTTITWLNDETEAGIQHTVTSYDPEDDAVTGEMFDSDLMSLGDTYSYTFPSEGVYFYQCSLHPFMVGKICVGEGSEALDSECAGIPFVGEETASETVDETDDFDFDEEPPPAETDEDDTVLGITDDDDDILDEAADEEPIPGVEETDEIDAVVDEEPFEEAEVLLPAADESVSSDSTDTTSDSSQSMQANTTTGTDEMPESGPEDFIYIFALLLALYIGYKKSNFSFAAKK